MELVSPVAPQRGSLGNWEDYATFGKLTLDVFFLVQTSPADR